MTKFNAEKFVIAWQASESHEEVARRTGLSKTYVNVVAVRLKKAGVRLKRMRTRLAAASLDVRSLNALIKEKS